MTGNGTIIKTRPKYKSSLNEENMLAYWINCYSINSFRLTGLHSTNKHLIPGRLHVTNCPVLPSSIIIPGPESDLNIIIHKLNLLSVEGTFFKVMDQFAPSYPFNTSLSVPAITLLHLHKLPAVTAFPMNGWQIAQSSKRLTSTDIANVSITFDLTVSGLSGGEIESHIHT